MTPYIFKLPIGRTAGTACQPLSLESRPKLKKAGRVSVYQWTQLPAILPNSEAPGAEEVISRQEAGRLLLVLCVSPGPRRYRREDPIIDGVG
jgi:hypothetical protein